MADIIALPVKTATPPDQLVWRCNCGCISFTLRADGEAECAQCFSLAGAVGEWRRSLPEPDKEVSELGAGDTSVTSLSDSGAALRRTLSKADMDTTTAVIILQSDGQVSTWGAYMETEEQRAWFDRRIETAKRMLTQFGT